MRLATTVRILQGFGGPVFRTVTVVNSRWKLNLLHSGITPTGELVRFIRLFSLPFLPPVLSAKMKGKSDPLLPIPICTEGFIVYRLAELLTVTKDIEVSPQCPVPSSLPFRSCCVTGKKIARYLKFAIKKNSGKNAFTGIFKMKVSHLHNFCRSMNLLK